MPNGPAMVSQITGGKIGHTLQIVLDSSMTSTIMKLAGQNTNVTCLVDWCAKEARHVPIVTHLIILTDFNQQSLKSYIKNI